MRGECALPHGSRVLVAVSGGPDSTALLLGLCRLAPELGLAPRAAHLHHGLRGAEADADLEHVRGLCARLGVPLVAARWDAAARMRRRGLAGQQGLRVLRREFLLAARRRVGARAIATAHTADDQLETLLFRLLRGAGLRGLAGIRPRGGPWIRPLLEAARSDVERDLVAAGVAWREDSSNATRGYARNRLRLDAIPALIRALDPALDPARARSGLARSVAAAAREARDAERALARSGRRLLSRATRIQEGDIALDSSGVGSYPIAAQRAALRTLWRRVAGDGTGLTRRHVDALCHLLTSGRSGGSVLLPSGWRAERVRKTILFRQGADSRLPGRSRHA